MKRSIGLLAATALAGIALPAGALADRAMTIDDLARIHHVGTALVSPDGQRVAYTLSEPRDIAAGDENGTSRTRLYVTDGPDREIRFSSGEGGLSNLTWDRDGDILFTAKRGDDTTTGIYELPGTGGEARRLFGHTTDISDFEIGPRGEYVWFIAAPKTDDAEKKARDKGFDANVYEENQQFAEVWRARLDGAGEPVKLPLKGHPSSIELSDDGQLLAVHVAPSTLVDDSLMEVNVAIVSAMSGALRATVDPEGKTGPAAFSPDGSKLALLSSVDRADPVAQTLAIADTRTGRMQIIDRKAEQHVQEFVWLDNDSVLTLAHQRQGSAFVTYNVDGTKENETAHEGIVAQGMDRNPNGRVAIVADSPMHPRALFISDAGAAPAKWTNHNEWLSDIEFHQQEVVRWTARDGVEIEGVLITPNGRAPRGGWPLIATIHGGPEAHDHNGWLTNYSRFGQIAAGAGFAVFYPNYRGSTGRGEDFAKLDHLDPPGDEFWDIVDGVNHLAEEGIVNKDKVGITGGSYGGFASAWGATIATEHFAASAPFVALTNLISFSGTTDIPVEMVDVHFMDHPWDNWQMYLEKSPTTHVDGSKTPTLILHGEADPRVHPAQSMELYRFMKQASDAPVRLVTYPGEGHGNRRAAAQHDYAQRVLRWMQHYLQGPGGNPPPPSWGAAEKFGK